MDSLSRQRRPRFVSRALRRFLELAMPGRAAQHAMAGAPLASVQDVPARSTPPRVEPGFGSSLDPAAEVDAGPAPSEPGSEPPAPPRRRWRIVKRTFLVLLLLALAAASAFGVYESRTSAMQARFFA